MARSIVVTSGKGGVGKSTITVALGRELCRRNQRVVLIDTDIGLNNLDVLLDMESRIVYDILDVVNNRCRVRQALIEDNMTGGLFLLPSAHAYEAGEITAQNIRIIVNSLAPSFDYILIDCPAGIELGFHRAVAAAREALVVTTPHISAIRDASRAIAILSNYGLEHRIVINRSRRPRSRKRNGRQREYFWCARQRHCRRYTRRRRDKLAVQRLGRLAQFGR